ncbi:MAG: tRNA uridine-5-carboxymethylaminomethyl(34) synthesis enzyme MnmG [Clostridia bacterium]|nr:tRNA uridine-5-carboxymethylaminomethyl(34) synthesis enzyme MnmG [Clostridia bacterium]
MENEIEKFDIAVIGGGHAGCEAALAAARLNKTCVMFTINLDAVGNMPCNPSIGGTAKGHLVREIDALGGEMGKAADAAMIQRRMLNMGKGPAVHSLRAQEDRARYRIDMKRRLEQQQNLMLRQAEVIDIEKKDGFFYLTIHTNVVYRAASVIIATGTYLEGRVIVGETSYPSGPDGMFPSRRLSGALRKMGISLMRFKTGTPARIHRRGIDVSVMEEQKGDEDITAFSFETEKPKDNAVSCFLTYTNKKTHDIIRANLDRSPLFSGMIDGVGPRYCPSIEDKVVRFADKERHQLFIEPMGIDTEEMYVQGMSSSLPEDVQKEMLHSVKGLENAQIMRCAYAIEYDCADPTQLKASLEFKGIPNLYGAGQFNGTSGYEEAAAQGLMAGINAARALDKKAPVILGRDEAYIGVLIDDLVTKGTREPYRMMTSRAEYRLLLRQDNADARLTRKGYEIGLISRERYEAFLQKEQDIENEIRRISQITLPPSAAINAWLESCGESTISTGVKMTELLRRPAISYDMLAPFDSKRPVLPKAVTREAEVRVQYEGYINRQKAAVERFRKNEELSLGEDFDYDAVYGLRIEAREKLMKFRPENIGQASRISGVSPADIGVLLIYLEARRREKGR